jgi:hypothetical protein
MSSDAASRNAPAASRAVEKATGDARAADVALERRDKTHAIQRIDAGLSERLSKL